MENKQTPAQMRRKIERLEAKVKYLDERVKQAYKMYTDHFHEACDYSMRIQQALAILHGEDE